MWLFFKKKDMYTYVWSDGSLYFIAFTCARAASLDDSSTTDFLLFDDQFDGIYCVFGFVAFLSFLTMDFFLSPSPFHSFDHFSWLFFLRRCRCGARSSAWILANHTTESQSSITSFYSLYWVHKKQNNINCIKLISLKKLDNGVSVSVCEWA